MLCDGPMARDDRVACPPPRRRWLSWLLLVAVVAGGLPFAGRATPSAAQKDDEWAVFSLEQFGSLGLVVSTFGEVKNIVICELIGGGLCQGDGTDVTVGDRGEPVMVLGPFSTQAQAIRAYCENIVPNTTHVLPLAAGTKAKFKYDGNEHDLDNGPDCSYIPEDTTPGPDGGETPEATEEVEPTETPEPEPCTVSGDVIDAERRPIAGVHIVLSFGTHKQDVATDSGGHYQFEEIGGEAVDGFDPATDTVRVSLILEEYAHQPGRFRVLFSRGTASIRSDRFLITPEEDCRRGFDIGAIPDDYAVDWPPAELWPDVTEIYQRTQNAWALADELGVKTDYGLPLRVFTFDGKDKDGDEKFGKWVGSTSNGLQFMERPYIALGDATSLLTDGGWPDNREYHEFGHHFLADAFGDAIPDAAANTNHAGYYRNPSSSDSWTEGFAEFYALMVSKYIDGEPMPELYRLGGGQIDLELDYRPWYGLGWGEELAVAGLLLDFEDGPEDYATGRAAPKLRVDWHKVIDDPSSGRLLIGMVSNLTPDWREVSEQTMVTAEFFNDGGQRVHLDWAATIPWDLPADGGRGFFSIPLPPSLEFASVRVVATEGRPGDVLTDDDPIDLTLEQLWSAIYRYASTKEESNGHTFDVSDLYRALSKEFGGQDRDGNGMEDVDQVFVAHGFFADDNGDRSYGLRDIIGDTSHPAFWDFPAFQPRYEMPPLPAGMAAIDAGGVEAAVLVHVAFPAPNEYRGYSYVTTPDANGRVYVAMPPPETDATATLVTLADGYLPAIAGRVEAADFWTQAEEHDGEPFLAFSVKMQPGTIEGRGPGGSNRTASLALIAGGALLTLGSVASVAVRRRKS